MAKTLNYSFTTIEDLEEFLIEYELQDYPNILVQIFSGEKDLTNVKQITRLLNEFLPKCVIIGCSTLGEIIDGQIQEESIVLSMTMFDKTKIKSCLVKGEEFASGKRIGRKLVSELCETGSKVLMVFPSASLADKHGVLEGIQEESQDVTIIGGAAGITGPNGESWVFDGTEFHDNAVVAAVLNNEHLTVQTYINNHWREIGKTFTITNAKDQFIYSLNSKKPVQILKKYLGESFVKGLPQSGYEFPLVATQRGESHAYFIMGSHQNGAIEINGKVNAGDELSFAYANIPQLIKQSIGDMKKLVKQPPETMFLYNCVARKRMLWDYSKKEAGMLQRIGNVSGFFATGEFCSTGEGKLALRGYTTVLIGLSENKHVPLEKVPAFKYTTPMTLESVNTLIHLIEATSSEIKGLNDELNISEQYYKSLFDNHTDFVYSTDLHGRFTTVNKSFETAFGYRKGEVLGQVALKYVRKEDVQKIRMHFYRTLKGKEQLYEVQIVTKSGEQQAFQIRNIPITVGGEIVGIYGIGRNITEQKKIQHEIEQLSNFDLQTGLPNRIRFTELLQEHIERNKKKRRQLAVLILDIDRFKIINDSLGHFAGDSVLNVLTNRIKEHMPSGTYMGRFGGDKFTLMMTKNVDMDSIRKAINKIQVALGQSILYDDQEFFITASVGVCIYPEDGQDAHDLMKNADTAMNRAKLAGGNRVFYYSNEMNEQAVHRLEMESNLRRAIINEEFYLCYQPLVDLPTGRIYGSEALIRWEHPNLGLISPVDFIPIAEETGLILDIGAWVLKTACKQNKEWQSKGLGDLIISVNVSAHQFQQPEFLQQVQQALDESGLDPEYLHLELTESVMIGNIHFSISIMQELQQLGVKVSIDDFGTGYSSLSYLKNLPIDYLKIDRSFINNLKDNTSDIAIVKAIITMGHGLAVKVVAEGVESKEQLDILKEMDCHYAQGYYIDKPLKVADFEEGLRKSHILV
ncbi:EAL domain-containing protein [Peribacillus alkalitolerans]|uniref:bifunctional diguanylate cyclase/phosphodiesterase n=1 Tax=Peribacillus alkalitolerans TaxID=1550385 RepID=UPI0013D1AD33|nr:EAL domain-containing protein [Peribacillus alkalitolerans]